MQTYWQVHTLTYRQTDRQRDKQYKNNMAEGVFHRGKSIKALNAAASLHHRQKQHLVNHCCCCAAAAAAAGAAVAVVTDGTAGRTSCFCSCCIGDGDGRGRGHQWTCNGRLGCLRLSISSTAQSLTRGTSSHLSVTSAWSEDIGEQTASTCCSRAQLRCASEARFLIYRSYRKTAWSGLAFALYTIGVDFGSSPGKCPQ